MNGFTEAFCKVEQLQSIRIAVEKNRLPMGVTGLSSIHKAHVVSSLCELLGRTALLVVPDEAQAVRLTKDLTGFGCYAYFYPAREYGMRSSQSQSREYEHMRLQVLSRMAAGAYDVVVASAEAASQLTLAPQLLAANSFPVSVGQTLPPQELAARLVQAGYTRADQVDGQGQFAQRGGVLDVFVPAEQQPCRLEFWGDTVDSISAFDLETQRRGEPVDSLQISPATEILAGDPLALAQKIEEHAKKLRGKTAGEAKQQLLFDAQQLRDGVRLASSDRYLPLVYENPATLFTYAEDALLFVSDSQNLKEAFKAVHDLFMESVLSYVEQGVLCRGLDRFMLTWPELLQQYEACGAVYLDNLPRGSFDTPIKELVSVAAKQITAWNGSLSVLLEDIETIAKRGDYTIVVLAGTEKAAQALCDDLLESGLRAVYHPRVPQQFAAGTVSVLQGSLAAGFEYVQAKFLLHTYAARHTGGKKRHRGYKATDAFHSLDELNKGDYVVHTAHGIGLFDGIESLVASGTRKDYIKILYDKKDILYVPVTQLDQVSKYIGPQSQEKTLKLNRLGGKEWQKTRTRVRGALKDMAKQLIALYSQRLHSEGHAFSPDIDMQSDFERRFEFEETGDQLRCIDEVKADMEKPYPMDRLLCGDVGFGKTEVALRAVFKCIADGKQCAFLVPTTILALQHYQTIQKRFEGFPVETRMLSRFCTKQEVAQTLKGLRRGSVDVVVGTHRLISKDVQFKDLGLIIVDEEQRFGVAQKERLKELFPTVDVLTLTATPIPRTLNMAMSGIRDMSVLEEAPQDRSPVQTFVIEHDLPVVAQAIRTELRRGGQVYYLHNRVETIERVAAQLKEELPQARIGIGHGKMSEDALSEIWRSLLEGEIDVLVCTTIIEAGVDVPNVNTLIIEDAENLGLSQLHQIRGRVGRSARRAYAYLTFRRGKQVSEIATRRLSAIREFTEFGSGFKIAMRDLELRGSGNVLGAQQHGHMEAVGYEMYLRLLEQAVREEKGELPPTPQKECLIDLPIDASIPQEYIASVPQRLAIYRRIADIHNNEDAADVLDELIDRFGEPPASVQGLIEIALLRADAMRHDVYEVTRHNQQLILRINALDMAKITAAAKAMPGRITVSASGKPHIAVKLNPREQQLDVLKSVLHAMDG